MRRRVPPPPPVPDGVPPELAAGPCIDTWAPDELDGWLADGSDPAALWDGPALVARRRHRDAVHRWAAGQGLSHVEAKQRMGGWGRPYLQP